MADATRPGKNRIISRKMIRKFPDEQPEQPRPRPALMSWYKVAENAGWTNFAAVRGTFGSADAVGHLIVFNIAGSKIRLAAEIKYNLRPRVIYIGHVLTTPNTTSSASSREPRRGGTAAPPLTAPPVPELQCKRPTKLSITHNSAAQFKAEVDVNESG